MMGSVHKPCAATIVTLALIIAGCSAASQDPCAGQCRAPYELFVGFRSALPPSRSVQVLSKCEHVPGVLRVSFDRRDGHGIVWTTFFGPESRSKNLPLQACLRNLPSVSWQIWPD
jgi:hypothetical protein